MQDVSTLQKCDALGNVWLWVIWMNYHCETLTWTMNLTHKNLHKTSWDHIVKKNLVSSTYKQIGSRSTYIFVTAEVVFYFTDVYVLNNCLRKVFLVVCNHWNVNTVMPCWQSGFNNLTWRLSVEAFPQDIYILLSHSQIQEVWWLSKSKAWKTCWMILFIMY